MMCKIQSRVVKCPDCNIPSTEDAAGGAMPEACRAADHMGRTEVTSVGTSLFAHSQSITQPSAAKMNPCKVGLESEYSMLELELGGWPGSCPVAQTGLEHAAILLTQPLKYWDYRHVFSAGFMW